MAFLSSREDILDVKLFEGFPKVKDYTSSKEFWLLLMLSYILNLSPFLDCLRLNFSFAHSLLRTSLDLIGP